MRRASCRARLRSFARSEGIWDVGPGGSHPFWVVGGECGPRMASIVRLPALWFPRRAFAACRTWPAPSLLPPSRAPQGIAPLAASSAAAKWPGPGERKGSYSSKRPGHGLRGIYVKLRGERASLNFRAAKESLVATELFILRSVRGNLTADLVVNVACASMVTIYKLAS